METDIKAAAIRFRFGKREELSAADNDFLRTHADAVAAELPQHIGEALFGFVGLDVPASYTGKIETDPDASMQELIRFMIADAKKPTSENHSIDQLLEFANSEAGRQRARRVLASQKGPLYSADPAHPGLIVETRRGGVKRVGRMQAGQFVEIAD